MNHLTSSSLSLPTYRRTCLSTYLPAYLSLCLYLSSLFVCLCLPVCLSVSPFLCLSLSPSFCPLSWTVCLSVCLAPVCCSCIYWLMDRVILYIHRWFIHSCMHSYIPTSVSSSIPSSVLFIYLANYSFIWHLLLLYRKGIQGSNKTYIACKWIYTVSIIWVVTR